MKHGEKVVNKVPHDERNEGLHNGRSGRRKTVGKSAILKTVLFIDRKR